MHKRIYIAGHNGLVGTALLKNLDLTKYEPIYKTHSELDLTSQEDVEDFFQSEEIDSVIIAAGKVGGILANSTFPADFIYENLMIAANCIHSAYKTQVKDLLYLGSSCIYPKVTPNPITEEQLLTSSLEPTNEPYAIAKIAGIKLCEYYSQQYGLNYRSVMPCNLYGIGDNYHEQNSHVIPGLIKKFHQAKVEKKSTVTLWGTGKPLREFLWADDLAKGCYKVLESRPEFHIVNIGSGINVSINQLANTIKKVVGYKGKIAWDTTKPDGTYSKLMNVDIIKSLGWKPMVKLEQGIELAYTDFKKINILNA